MRKSAPAARAAIIAADQALLMAEGPESLTAARVARKAGIGHPLLLHHFGSVHGMHTALLAAIAERFGETVEQAVAGLRRGEATGADLVDVVFDAFAAGGAGRLTAWLVLASGPAEADALVAELTRRLGRLADDSPTLAARLGEVAQVVVALVLGDAQVGDTVAAATAGPRDAARRQALHFIRALEVPQTDQSRP